MTTCQERVPTPRWLILNGWAAAVAFASGGVGMLITIPPPAWQSIILGVLFLALAVLWVGIALGFNHLHTEVREDSVRFRYGPLGKTISAAHLTGIEVEPYRWLVYGGWGIRFALGKRRAYSVPGCREGVVFLLRDGTRYHVSSRAPQELAQAARPQLSQNPGDPQGLPPPEISSRGGKCAD